VAADANNRQSAPDVQKGKHAARRTGDISTPTALVGFVSAQSKEPEAAKALLRYLSSPEATAVYQQRGMRPGG